MAAELRDVFGAQAQVELVEGSRGVFDVFLANERVFSKHELHRFPEPGELRDLAARIRDGA